MNFSKKKIRQKAFILILLLILSLCLFSIYNSEIQPMNAYAGMKPLIYEGVDYLLMIAMLVIIALLIPIAKITPSSLFVYFYLLLVIMPMVALWGASGYLKNLDVLILFFLLIFPVVTLKTLSKFVAFRSRRCIAFSRHIFKVEVLLGIAVLCAAIFSWKYLKSDFSFAFDDSYVRRMAGREEVLTGSFIAYLLSMSMNGFSPFLAFYAGYKKKWVFFVLALSFALFSYGALGVKAPLQYVLVLYVLGKLLRRNKVIFKVGIYCLIIIFLLALLSHAIFGYSIISDIFIRRAFAVPAQIQGFFYDYIFHFHNLNFFNMSDQAITFQIGSIYSDVIGTNANTNTFLYELGQNGIVGYICAIVFLSIFFIILDILYCKTKGGEFLGIALIYSLLLIEQNFTTAFISSGVGVLFLLYSYFKTPDTMRNGVKI